MAKNAVSQKGAVPYQIDRPNIMAPSDWKPIAHDGNPDEIIESLLGLMDNQTASVDYPNFCIFVFGKDETQPGTLMLSLKQEEISD